LEIGGRKLSETVHFVYKAIFEDRTINKTLDGIFNQLNSIDTDGLTVNASITNNIVIAPELNSKYEATCNFDTNSLMMACKFNNPSGRPLVFNCTIDPKTQSLNCKANL
jgi:hypothetical protein